MSLSRGLVALGWVVFVGSLLVACGTPVNRAPVENRGTYAGVSSQSTPPASAAPEAPTAPDAQSPQGAENANRPGYYTVQPGDTLIRIGLETGQGWKDLALWNQLENPNQLEIGQVIRVVPPVGEVASQPPPAERGEAGVVTRPVTTAAVTPTASGKSGTAVATGKPAAPATTKPATTKPADPPAAPAAPAKGGFNPVWPATGKIVAQFDMKAERLGIDVAGKAGDGVLAAADGQVVYAGAGLEKYGNLILIKHSEVYLTAYAHNRKLLVKEDQRVRRGQKIAEMGNSGTTGQVRLHFEIRRRGQPVDPLSYLPKR